MPTTSLFWFVVFAGVGGVLVAVGLFMEQAAEKNPYKHVGQFRRCKEVKFCGEWLVILGVLIEVVVAGVTAKNEWSDAPLNQPVSKIDAQAQVAVFSPVWLQPRSLAFEGSDIVLTGNDINTNLPFFGLNLHGRPGQMGMNGANFGTSNNIIEENMYFEDSGVAQMIMSDASNNIINLPSPTVKEVLDEVKTMVVYADYFPTNSKIFGGQVILRVNGFSKAFRIPKQEGATNFEVFPAPTDGRGMFFWATNQP